MLTTIIIFFLLTIQKLQAIPVIDQSNGQEIDLNRPASTITTQIALKSPGPSNDQSKHWKVGQTVAEVATEAAKNSGHINKSEEYWKVYRKIFRKARKEKNLYFANNFNDEKAKQVLKTDRIKSNARTTKYIKGIYQRKKEGKPTLRDKHYFDKRVQSSRRLYLKRTEREKQQQLQQRRNSNSLSITPNLSVDKEGQN